MFTFLKSRITPSRSAERRHKREDRRKTKRARRSNTLKPGDLYELLSSETLYPTPEVFRQRAYINPILRIPKSDLVMFIKLHDQVCDDNAGMAFTYAYVAYGDIFGWVFLAWEEPNDFQPCNFFKRAYLKADAF